MASASARPQARNAARNDATAVPRVTTHSASDCPGRSASLEIAVEAFRRVLDASLEIAVDDFRRVLDALARLPESARCFLAKPRRRLRRPLRAVQCLRARHQRDAVDGQDVTWFATSILGAPPPPAVMAMRRSMALLCELLAMVDCADTAARDACASFT